MPTPLAAHPHFRGWLAIALAIAARQRRAACLAGPRYGGAK
jgi:hypothetical protein